MLDTTVNHVPEVFEYQFEPDVAGHTDDGEHEYILAGSSCLAGDVLGEYSFEDPLQIGSRVVVTGVGAVCLGEGSHVQRNQPSKRLFDVLRRGPGAAPCLRLR